MPGAWCARSRAWVVKTRALVTTVTPETPGIPRAMVLTGSFVLAPETGLCVSVGDNARALHWISASGYQAHTTSPSASLAFVVREPKRPPHPLPNVRDDAYAPHFRVRDGSNQ